MKGQLSRSERFERIVAELRASPAVRISALAKAFDVSTETVRRDLDELSRRGLVARTYGGAALHPLAREPDVNERYRQRVEERARIAARAATLVAPGDVLMIDSGSTTSHLARRLAASAESLTVLTNSLNVAGALGQNPKLRVILCPGDVNPREAGVYGPETAAFPCGVKRAMIARAERRLLLVDQGQFEVRALQLVCPLAELDDVIADAAPGPELRQALAKAEVTLHLAGT
jgi:DeoR/GlpR family transcriptional regulator of sugar metabolism